MTTYGETLDLFNPAEGRRRRDEGIERVSRGRDYFIERALAAIRDIPSGCDFTTDDLWPSLPKTSEPRVMGAVVSAAKAEGLIDPTDEYRCSARPEAHRNPKRVWRRR